MAQLLLWGGGGEVGSRLCDGESAGGSAVDEGRSRSGDGVGRAEPLGPAGADSAGECGSVVQVPTLAAGGGSHPPAARPEAEESVCGGGGWTERSFATLVGGIRAGSLGVIHFHPCRQGTSPFPKCKVTLKAQNGPEWAGSWGLRGC